jgi:hypothetical protein
VVDHLLKIRLKLKQLLLFKDLANDQLCRDFHLLKVIRLVIFYNMFFKTCRMCEVLPANRAQDLAVLFYVLYALAIAVLVNIANVAIQHGRLLESLRAINALLGLGRSSHENFFRSLFRVMCLAAIFITLLFFIQAFLR